MYGFVRSAHSSVGTSAAARISSPPIVGVPALARCDCGPFLPDHLADLEIAQPPDHHGPSIRLSASAVRLAAAVRNVM